MKLVLGKWAVDRVASGATPQQAASAAINYLYTRLGGHGGIILLGPDGQIGIAHNTPPAWPGASPPQKARNSASLATAKHPTPMPPELFTNPDDLEATRRPLTPEQADKLRTSIACFSATTANPKPPRPLGTPLTQLIYSLLSARTKTPYRIKSCAISSAPSTPVPATGNLSATHPSQTSNEPSPSSPSPSRKLLSSSRPCKASTARYGSLTLDFLAKYRTDRSAPGSNSSPASAPRPAERSSTSAPSVAAHSASTAIISASCNASASSPAPTPPPPKNASCASSPKPGTPPPRRPPLPSSSSTAKTLCTFSDPKCENCPLLKICPTGQRNLAELQLTAPPA